MAEEPIQLFDLFQKSTQPSLDIIRWIQDLGLIAKNYTCPKCNKDMVLREFANTDNHIWRCTKCKVTRSIRKGSWFEGSHLKLMDVMILTYMWVWRYNQNKVMHELKIRSEHTVTDWLNFCRKICTEIVQLQTEQIGGPNAVVEIDESKFGKRKYNRGRRVEGKWVMGGVERDSNRCFLQVVEDRSAETLVPLIERFIAPGSTIISDCWRAYERLGERGYNHLTVNHSVTFKDPETGAHTNTIEGLWSQVKRMFHHTNRAPGLFTSYLAEFMYRNIHKNSGDLFQQFLLDIASLSSIYL